MASKKHLRNAETLARCASFLKDWRNERARAIEDLIVRLDYLDDQIANGNMTGAAREYHVSERRALAWAILELAGKYPQLFGADTPIAHKDGNPSSNIGNGIHTMQCDRCGGTMTTDPSGEVKTLHPPLYNFKCQCGNTKWAKAHKV